MSKRICVVSGSRAEYGLMYWVLHELKQEPTVFTSWSSPVLTCHTSSALRCARSRPTAFRLQAGRNAGVERHPGGVAKSIGLGVIGMSDALADLRPDVAMVLGDRFEILAAAQA